jgi:hypothetical protein
MRHLAGLPFARELRPFGGGWRAIEADELDRDLEIAALGARRLFDEAAKPAQTASSFSVLRGATAEMIAAMSQAGDIVMLVEPGTPAERLTRPFVMVLEAALRSAASVMLVPSRLARRRGPVVAIARSPGDRAIAAAVAIAAATHEDLVVVQAFVADRAFEIAAAASVRVTTRAIGGGQLADARAVSAALAGVNERLVVVSRDDGDREDPSTIPSLRGVPVLVVE